MADPGDTEPSIVSDEEGGGETVCSIDELVEEDRIPRELIELALAQGDLHLHWPEDGPVGIFWDDVLDWIEEGKETEKFELSEPSRSYYLNLPYAVWLKKSRPEAYRIYYMQHIQLMSLRRVARKFGKTEEEIEDIEGAAHQAYNAGFIRRRFESEEPVPPYERRQILKAIRLLTAFLGEGPTEKQVTRWDGVARNPNARQHIRTLLMDRVLAKDIKGRLSIRK